MPLNFTPKSEDDIQPRFAPLPPGDYPFTVMESAEVASKSTKNAGRLMVKLKINVHGPKSDVHVYDHFADWFSEWKLKHFCETANLAEEYNAGGLDASENAWQGRRGVVTLEIEPESKRDGKTYAAKNAVVDYVPKAVGTTPAKASAKADTDLAPDDVPF